MPVRTATGDDVDAICDLGREVREQLAELEPRFRRPHRDAAVNQRAWFRTLLKSEAHRVLVYEREPDDVVGFVIGQLVPAPPIFDPGGKTLLVDDGRWPNAAAGEALFAALRTWAVKQGATQLVGVTAVGDEDRRATFDALGLHPTTEWWTKEL